jgi:hypothetical protein
MAITPKNDTDINVDKISEKTATSGITLDDQVLCDEEIQYKDTTAPGNPASGVSVFSESGVLKALTDAGVTTQLGLLPVKYSTNSATSTSTGSDTFGDQVLQAITAEADEAIVVIGTAHVSNGTIGSQARLRVEIDGNNGEQQIHTEQLGTTGGDQGAVTCVHVETGLSGSINVCLAMRRAQGGTAYMGSGTLHVFQFKFRS